jgi:hypothetical protein
MGSKIYTVVFIITFGSTCLGATYYVDGSAKNNRGNGSYINPKKNIPSGIDLMSNNGGDILIIKNGNYIGPSNEIKSFKTGKHNAFNIIKAESDGGVIVSSNFIVDSGNYVQVEGMKFDAAATKYCAANYIKFLRCAFQNGAICSKSCDGQVVYAAGSYQLYEDCWFYGIGGRYTLLVYESHHDVFRRCVIRRDGGYSSDGSNPEAPLANYAAGNISYQNCIVIDNNLKYSTAYTTSYYITGHAGQPSSNNVEFIGCIDLNGQNGSFYIDTDDGSTGMSLTDCVFYQNGAGISMSNRGVKVTLNRITMGNMTAAINQWKGEITLANGVVYNHGAPGSGVAEVQYTNTFNPNSWSATGIAHKNPATNGLLYLTRIEAGSQLKRAGYGSSQMGAQVVHKIGTDGTLYGETGYNTVTANALWPWPYEDRIKSDFASVNGGARGFATGKSRDGSPQTLTKYIWEYLGNEMPPDVYDRAGSKK